MIQLLLLFADFYEISVTAMQKESYYSVTKLQKPLELPVKETINDYTVYSVSKNQ